MTFEHVVKYVPEWMPGAGFKTKARIWRLSSLWTLNTPWQVVKDRMVRTLSYTQFLACVAYKLSRSSIPTVDRLHQRRH